MAGAGKLAVALALLAAGGSLSDALWKPPFPPPQEVPTQAEEAFETMALLSLGMRRAAADIGFVRLLQYYGRREGEDEFHYLQAHEHEHTHGEGGVYPELLARARHIAALDPYFHQAVLYSAGALAFNLERPDEAVELLEEAIRRHPRQWRYQAYLAAIGFHRAARPERAADTLLPLALDPDSPALVKQTTAFLLKRIGRREQAVRVYRLILETTVDPGYLENARRSLAELGASP